MPSTIDPLPNRSFSISAAYLLARERTGTRIQATPARSVKKENDEMVPRLDSNFSRQKFHFDRRSQRSFPNVERLR